MLTILIPSVVPVPCCLAPPLLIPSVETTTPSRLLPFLVSSGPHSFVQQPAGSHPLGDHPYYVLDRPAPRASDRCCSTLPHGHICSPCSVRTQRQHRPPFP